MEILYYVIIIVAGYLIGNFSPAIVLSKLKKRDIRTLDSGNPGTMNMIRNFGYVIGVSTLALDTLKGVIPTLLGWFILGERFSFAGDRIGIYVAGLATIIGHIFPVFYKFKGGKGVATTLGIMFTANPLAGLVVFAAGIVVYFTFKIGSLTSFVAIYTLIGIEGIRFDDLRYSILLFALFLVTFLAHHSNIVKLLKGTEKSMSRKKRAKDGDIPPPKTAVKE